MTGHRGDGTGLRIFGLQTLVVAGGLGVFALVATLLRTFPSAQSSVLVVAFGALHLWIGRRCAPAGPAADRGPSSRAALLTAVPLLALGVLLAALPLVWTGHLRADGADLGRGFAALSAASVAGTAASVAWEELWLRNPLVHRVAGTAATWTFALWNGLLFAAVHLLNPAFDPLAEGLELVLAGALLTLLCRVGGGVLAPFLVHFAFNLTSAVARAGVASEVAATMDDAAVSHRRCLLLVCACAVAAVAVGLRAGIAGRPASGG